MNPNKLLFDTALAHIEQQDDFATITLDDGEAACSYFTPEGKMCAFAPALIDPETTPNLDAMFLLEDEPGYVKPEFREVKPEFAWDIQRTHDKLGTSPEIELIHRMAMYRSDMQELKVKWRDLLAGD